MELAVLRNSSRFLSPLGLGASYLVEAGGARVLLDSAHGVDRRLLERLGGTSLDAIVLSHFHREGLADLEPVLAAFRPRRLLAADGACRVLRRRAPGVSVESVRAGSETRVRNLVLRFGEADHGCPGLSVRFEADGATLAHLGDTGPRPGLASVAAGADLVLAHVLYRDGEADAGRAATNLTAGEAGRIARRAGARRLALAHVPFYADAEESAREAAAAFGAPATVLREGDVLVVGASPR